MRPKGVSLIPLSDTEALREAIERHLDAPRGERARTETHTDNAGAVCDFYGDLLSG
jgi:hypothetical protein